MAAKVDKTYTDLFECRTLQIISCFQNKYKVLLWHPFDFRTENVLASVFFSYLCLKKFTVKQGTIQSATKFLCDFMQTNSAPSEKIKITVLLDDRYVSPSLYKNDIGDFLQKRNLTYYFIIMTALETSHGHGKHLVDSTSHRNDRFNGRNRLLQHFHGNSMYPGREKSMSRRQFGRSLKAMIANFSAPFAFFILVYIYIYILYTYTFISLLFENGLSNRFK